MRQTEKVLRLSNVQATFHPQIKFFSPAGEVKEKPRTFFPRHPPPPKSSTALDIYMQMLELFEDKKLSARIRCD